MTDKDIPLITQILAEVAEEMSIPLRYLIGQPVAWTPEEAREIHRYVILTNARLKGVKRRARRARNLIKKMARRAHA